MNLTNFLKQADTLAAQYSAEQLQAFIHNIARTLPEGHREDFLNKLKAIGGHMEEPSHSAGMTDSEFKETYRQIRNNLMKIDSQEITVSGILNEEYDDWYDDSSEEFYYEDNDGISDMLAEACDFIHACMDTERYQEGFEIGSQMFFMEILCTNEYGDEEFALKDLVYHKLLNCDMKQLLLDTLHCAYHAMPLNERPDALYKLIANSGQADITLEALMQHGDEALPDFEDFLTSWITYLVNKTGHNADRLIIEAVGLLNDAQAAIKYAKKFATVHPGLYLNLLDAKNISDINTLVALGMDAINRIPKKYIIRQKVALKTAEYIIKANAKQSLLEKCYFAAYESDTSALNYMRALLNGYGTETKRNELQTVLKAIPASDNDSWMGLHSEREENKPDKNTVLLLQFLNGQFQDVLANGLGKSEALGWSGTFMKQGIALYLLYLYADKGQWAEKGILKMADTVKNTMGFSAEEYYKGVSERENINNEDLFYHLFSQWKSMTPMDSDVRAYAIKRLAELLEKRTEGIMDANRRNYYGECAAYIAALGEVQESLGDKGAKQRLMGFYKNKYSRRSAFRAELQFYGWKDTSRK